jgi:hypothetical protein
MVQITKLINPPSTKRQLQLIAGTIMGGSSLIKPKKGRHCYLSMRDKNGYWLEYKAGFLKNFASLEPFTKEKTNRWHSLCFPVFDQFLEIFYKEGKRYIDVNTLSKFWDFGLMIWFGDCGKYINGEIRFNTHIWGEEGTKIISEYFLLCGWNTRPEKYCIVFDPVSSIKFLKTVEPVMPNFLLCNHVL